MFPITRSLGLLYFYVKSILDDDIDVFQFEEIQKKFSNRIQIFFLGGHIHHNIP